MAAEAEAGTTQFAWMQSITRRRWLAVKVGWMLLAAAVWGAVISALVTWWEGPDNALQLDAFKPGRFDIMGVVPVAYSLFAVALGIAAGALTRRVLPAMAVTLAGFIAARAAVALWLRPHYMSTVTVLYTVTSGFTPPGSYWQIASGVLGPNGQELPQPNNTLYFDGIPFISYRDINRCAQAAVELIRLWPVSREAKERIFRYKPGTLGVTFIVCQYQALSLIGYDTQ